MRHSDTLSHATGDSEMTNTEWTTKTKKERRGSNTGQKGQRGSYFVSITEH